MQAVALGEAKAAARMGGGSHWLAGKAHGAYWGQGMGRAGAGPAHQYGADDVDHHRLRHDVGAGLEEGGVGVTRVGDDFVRARRDVEDKGCAKGVVVALGWWGGGGGLCW
jgi:hypothetical protein